MKKEVKTTIKLPYRSIISMYSTESFKTYINEVIKIHKEMDDKFNPESEYNRLRHNYPVGYKVDLK
jgi:hypothetical protein